MDKCFKTSLILNLSLIVINFTLGSLIIVSTYPFTGETKKVCFKNLCNSKLNIFYMKGHAGENN